MQGCHISWTVTQNTCYGWVYLILPWSSCYGWNCLQVVDRIQPQSNKFAKGVNLEQGYRWLKTYWQPCLYTCSLAMPWSSKSSNDWLIDWLIDWCSQAVLENSQNTSYNIRVHRTDSVLWHDYINRRKEKTTTDSAASTHICSSCGKDCHSRIGLISHRWDCLERSTTIWQW